MAQLPPKAPTTTTTMPPSWPNFGHHRPPLTMASFLPAAAAAPIQPSWVDEFLDFSSARRGSHRRSVSDSIAFLDPPQMTGGNEFDRLDDDQLMSMFSDDVPPPSQPPPTAFSNPSTPSDHNSINDEKPSNSPEQPAANESEEAQSTCKTEQQAPPQPGQDPIVVDPKRVKRILANRQSAQRSRVRKLQYISELERSVTTLQTEVSALSPRVAFFDHQRSILTVGNSHLKQRIAALAQDKIFKDAHQEALRKEIERLRQVYHRQNLKNLSEPTSESPATARNEEELHS